jgi:hypothetical protein
MGEPDQLMKWIRMKIELKMARTMSNLLRDWNRKQSDQFPETEQSTNKEEE